MKMKMLAMAGAAATAMFATTAHAQMAPMGEELYGQSVQVRFADGTTNTVYFNQNGTATIRAPGADPVNATWAVQNNQMCLMAMGDTECWGYTNRFMANTPVSLTSTCNVASTWTAASVAPMQTAPVQQVQPVARTGERG